MLRLVLFLLAIVALATGFSWLADRPGLITFNWEGYEGEITVFRAVVFGAVLAGVLILLWTLLRTIWFGPAELGRYFYRRRQKRGLDALSSGMIAIGAGDKSNAMRYAIQARKTLPNEPLTHLLRAQAAQLSGDKATSRRIFEAMLAAPDTEQLGLRGLFLEAQREGETEAARQFAERALSLNPRLGWSAEALFDLQCKQHDWNGALTTLASGKKFGHIEKTVADRRRAVLLTAQAQALEDSDAERALNLATEAHNLAPGLVPAAAIAGRILAARGNVGKAAKIIQKTWLKSPHPDLAAAYAYARVGDSPRDRLDRVRQLAALTTNSMEGPIAVARTAIEARDFDTARYALEPLLDERLTQRVATLMARIEAEQSGDKGRVREWLARAAHAGRDPVWTADGVVSETWAPMSPVTGQLDAFEWRVLDAVPSAEGALLAQQIEEYTAIGSPLEVLPGKAVDVTATTAAATVSAQAPAATAAPAMAEAKATTAAPAQAVPAEKTAPATPAPSVTQAPVEAEVVESKAVAPAPSKVEPRAAPSVVVEPAPSKAAAAAAANGAVAAKPATAAPSTAVTVTAPAKPVAAPPQSGGGATSPAPNSASAPASAGKDAVLVTPAPARTTAAAPQPASGSASAVDASRTAPRAPAVANAAEAKAVQGKPGKAEPAIFISPRAPDDPGPDGDEGDGTPVRQRYGTTR